MAFALGIGTVGQQGQDALFAIVSQPVNVNSATAEQIADALKGVGQTKAEAIVNYRDKHGKFKHIDELVNVKGIGLRTVDINREYILLGDKQTANK